MSINFRKKDPHFKKEQAAYQHPVPSRAFISECLQNHGKPADLNFLIEAFSLENPDEQEGIRRRLSAMVRDGELLRQRNGLFALAKESELISGCVEANRAGFGFLVPDDGGEDLFLSAKQMQAVFHGDRVLAREVLGRDNRSAGAIVKVLSRAISTLSGRFYRDGNVCFVSPDDPYIVQDIVIPVKKSMRAKNGQYVLVRIIEQPMKRRLPVAEVVEVIGDELTPGVEIELAIRSHDIPAIWPKPVLKAAKKMKPRVLEKDKIGRDDLRHLFFVTIDGEDAQDFDDAVYAEKRTDGGFCLWVAIADVAHYVTLGSALDEVGYLRANSTYFPGRVVPMLPEILSNELCSLKPNQDRLALTCRINLDAQGHVEDYQFLNAVIHSHKRLTYKEAARFIDHTAAPETPELGERLDVLYALYQALRLRRSERGSIEFDGLETQIIFDKLGKIACIEKRSRNDAHCLIEEMMLLANQCAAEFTLTHKLKVLYRNHEKPDSTKLNKLHDFLKVRGLSLSGGLSPSASDYVALSTKIKERADAHLINVMLLRSMQKAVYSPESKGHFGLAMSAYTHFTSPIRRYPDLLLHRAIKHVVAGLPVSDYPYDDEAMLLLGEHCSMTERRSDLATRDATDWLKCYYLKDRLGEVHEGVVTDVTSFGCFVELRDIYVQGLVHITDLQNDYYHYEPKRSALIGKQSGKVYELGAKLTVKIARVSLDDRKIDFALAG